MAGGLEEARTWMHLAEEALGAARTLSREGYYRRATSNTYYAMFYAAKAAIILEGVDVSKHSAVISAFARNYSGLLCVQCHSWREWGAGDGLAKRGEDGHALLA